MTLAASGDEALHVLRENADSIARVRGERLAHGSHDGAIDSNLNSDEVIRSHLDADRRAHVHAELEAHGAAAATRIGVAGLVDKALAEQVLDELRDERGRNTEDV